MGLLLRLAWRNLWRHARRTWLTASAIAFAAMLLVFMITLQLGAYDMMIDVSLRVFPGYLQVQRQGYLDKPQMRHSISEAEVLAQTIRQATPDTAVAVRAYGFALAASAERSYGVQVVGVQSTQEKRVSTIPGLIRRGKYLASDTQLEVVVGEKLARNLKIDVGSELVLLGSGKDGSMAATVVPVVGIFASGAPDIDRNMVQMPLRSFQEVFSMGHDAHAIVISPRDLTGLDLLRTRVQALLPPDQDLVALNWEQVLPALKQLIEVDKVQNWFMYLCLIVIVTFSILNTFLMSVLERTREFGIMLALGAGPGTLGVMVMLESLMLSLLGLVIGIFLGGLIAGYFYIHGFTFPGMEEIYAQFGLPGVITPKISALTLLLGPGVILAFTLAASLYPALRLRRLQPVSAMHAV